MEILSLLKKKSKDVGYLIVIFNAAKENTNILQLIPSYARRHYLYLKDLHPSFFPPSLFTPSLSLQQPVSPLSIPSTASASTQVQYNLQNCENRISEVLQKIERGMYESAAQEIEFVCADLKLICELKPSESSTTEFSLHFVNLISVLLQLRKQKMVSVKMEQISILFEQSYSLQFLFLGIPLQVKQRLLQQRLFSNLLLFFSSSSFPSQNQSCEPFVGKEFEFVLQRMNALKQFSSTHNLPLDPSSLKLFRVIENFSKSLLGSQSSLLPSEETESESKFKSSSLQLFSFLLDFVPPPLLLSNKIKRKQASISSPKTCSSNSLRFSCLFPLSFKVVARIENVCEISSIKLLVVFPSEKGSQLISLSSEDFVWLKPMQWKLRKKVSIHSSNLNWVGVCFLRIFVVDTFKADIPELDDSHGFSHCFEDKESSLRGFSPKDSPEGLVVISNEFKLFVSPSY